MDYLEFIAQLRSRIPDRSHVMVRYYGLYANAHRGKVRKAHREGTAGQGRGGGGRRSGSGPG